MESTTLRPEQAERLGDQVRRQLRYLNRLCQRMTRLGFPPHDPLYVVAVKARAAMQDLHMAAHYASCKHGVGRVWSELGRIRVDARPEARINPLCDPGPSRRISRLALAPRRHVRPADARVYYAVDAELPHHETEAADLIDDPVDGQRSSII